MDTLYSGFSFRRQKQLLLKLTSARQSPLEKTPVISSVAHNNAREIDRI